MFDVVFRSFLFGIVCFITLYVIPKIMIPDVIRLYKEIFNESKQGTVNDLKPERDTEFNYIQLEMYDKNKKRLFSRPCSFSKLA